MPLTKENMKIDPTGNKWDYAALMEDVNQMSSEQLDKYVRLAFLGEIDPEFLPPHSYFWRAFSVYGGGDRGPSTPGDFFAGIYTTIPSAHEGKYTRHDGTKIDVDPMYRSRFEQVLKGILEECLNYDGEPTKRELMLAKYAVETVDHIRFSDGSDSPEEQFVKAIEERGSMPVTEAVEIMQKLKYPDVTKNELFQLARRLMKHPRYSR
jgi:hypothetical protein